MSRKSVYVFLHATYGLLVTSWILLKLMLRGIFPRRLESLRGQTVLVTRVGSALGKELAFGFAREGAHVVCWDEELKASMDTVYDIRHEGGEATGFACDPRSPPAVLRTAAATLRRVGSVDILLGSAGEAAPARPLAGWGEAEISALFNGRVLPLLWVVRAVLPYMLRRNKGHIVAISATSALRPAPHQVPHAASMGAVSGLMDALLQEVRLTAGNKVRTTCVYPDFQPLEGNQSLTCKFSSPTPTLTDVALEIVKGVRQGREAFSVPRNMFFYTNLLRCFPQEVRSFWKSFAYMDTYAGDELRAVVGDGVAQLPCVEVIHHGDESSLPAGTSNRDSRPEQSELIFGDSGQPPNKADLDYRFDIPGPSTSKDKESAPAWRILPPSTSMYDFCQEEVLPMFAGSSICTLFKRSFNRDSIFSLSDSTNIIEIPELYRDSETEIAQPSWVIRITESLVNSDWRRKLYEVIPGILIPASSQYLYRVEELTRRVIEPSSPTAALPIDNVGREQTYPSKLLEKVSSWRQRELRVLASGSADRESELQMYPGRSQHVFASSVHDLPAPPAEGTETTPQGNDRLAQLRDDYKVANKYSLEYVDASDIPLQSTSYPGEKIQSHPTKALVEGTDSPWALQPVPTPYTSAVDIIQGITALARPTRETLARKVRFTECHDSCDREDNSDDARKPPYESRN